MAFSIEEIYETARMILFEKLDIRTTTLGINIKDCIHSNFSRFQKNVYKKIIKYGRALVKHAKEIEIKYGIPIVNKRISITPITLVMEPHATREKYISMAKTIDIAAKEAEIDYIGGFGALVQKGTTEAEKILIDCIPDVISSTQRVCCFLNAGTTSTGLNMDVVKLMGDMLIKTARNTSNGIGCTRFVIFVNAPEDNPFMAGAFHGPGEPETSLNIGISGPGAVRSVVEKNRDCDLTELSEIIKRTVFKITRAGELVGREMAEKIGVSFGIVDISLAPTPLPGDSVAEIVEAFGIEKIGAPGSTLAIALLMDAVKKGGAMASGNIGGLSGTFIPVSEDSGMADAVASKALSIEKLEAFTSVCSVGLDMIAIPGDTPPDTISAIIADELAIGIINNKTTAVRIIPVPGKKAGEKVNFGGLLGEMPVMAVNKFSSAKFIKRGGRLPSPVISLRN
ncbi:MAG TPA: PFL family protein [bacterium]|nr:PFL family protein [bacterium]HOL34640.1 PFL family protein [bacterium]HPP08186.1 PFL family protein [bacterium]